MQKDVKDWAQAINKGLTIKHTPPVNLMQKLLNRKTSSKKKGELTSKASTLSTLGVANQFYIGLIGSYHKHLSTPLAASL